jgi:hypothetical protein
MIGEVSLEPKGRRAWASYIYFLDVIYILKDAGGIQYCMLCEEVLLYIKNKAGVYKIGGALYE